MIIVTSATGRLGGLTTTALLERVPAAEVGVAVRAPEKAADLAARGVDVRRGDFADPDGLAEAFAGADTVLLVSAGSLGDEARRLHTGAIEAAQRAGVRRLVYTSHQGASPTSAFAPMLTHAETEATLAASGLRWTALRNGFYASTLDVLRPQVADGVLRVPGDGPVSWTTHEDLAEAAALTLLDRDAADGPTPPLTGPEALGVGEAIGARVETVPAAPYVATMVERGVPEARAAMVVGMFEAFAAGEFDVVDPALERLLGRAPLSAVASSGSARG